MAFRDRFRKAKGQAPQGAEDISELIRTMTALNGNIEDRNSLLRQMPVDPRWTDDQFGPLSPIPSDPLDPPNEQGFAIPRISQYQAGYNYDLSRGLVPWDTLKAAADQPLARACIEIRKNRISTLGWTFRVRPQYAARIARQRGEQQYKVEDELRKEFQDEIDRLTTFWEIPDRRNGYEFPDWMSMVQEEQLVWDALAIYPQKTYGGDLLDLTVINGSTIKPLLDEQGGRPRPPFPGYQQIMYGFPRGDFTADMVDLDGKLVVPGAFSTSQLVYRRRVSRTWTPYGFSPTEQSLLDSALWDKRFRWMMAEYTEGAQPVQWLVNHNEIDWDVKQLLGYERYLNDRLAGKTGQRYRNPLLPAGIEPVRSEQAPERYTPEYDLFLIKLQAMHYGVTMPELGFSEPGGLGSTGYHEGEEDIQFRKDLTTTRWLNSFVTNLSRTHLDMSDALEFTFLGLDEEDEGVQDAIDEGRLKLGRRTLNEVRGEIGDPPYDFPEADMPMLMTERGLVFIAGAAEAAPPGVLVEPAELNREYDDPNQDTDQNGQPGDQSKGGQPKQKVSGSPKPARPVKQSPSAAEMAKELEQFGKWLAKGRDYREFEWRYVDPSVPLSQEMHAHLVKGSTSGDDADPKVSTSGDGPKLTPSSLYSRPSS
jgi:hypothetical protein